MTDELQEPVTAHMAVSSEVILAWVSGHEATAICGARFVPTIGERDVPPCNACTALLHLDRALEEQ